MSDYLRELFGLEGKTAVVVGGTGVLCGQMGEALALAGAKVMFAGREPEKGASRVAAIRAAGGDAFVQGVDVTSRESLEELFQAALVELGSVDVLVNGAGVNSATPYFEISPDDWRRVLDVNLTAVHATCQIFARHMTERGSGSIVNVASVSSILPLSRVFAYSASKAAVLNYTRNLARELAPTGVRVNAISPGFFPAEQNRAILDAERTEKILAKTPLGRFGEPAELDAAILLLASDRAGGFLVGHNLVVDGGFSITAI